MSSKAFNPPLTEAEKACYFTLNQDNLAFLMDRYNRVNRWVIADMVRRTAYRYPDKKALIFGDRSLTYAELEAESNRVANALIDLGIKKYDRVGSSPTTPSITSSPGLAAASAGPSTWPSITCCGARTSATASTTPSPGPSSSRIFFTNSLKRF